MPDHDPQLVETVARALFDHAQDESRRLGRAIGLTTWDRANRDYWHNSARAALSAMPRPIGYSEYRSNGHDQWVTGYINDRETAEKIAATLSKGDRVYAVVALVPVDGGAA